MFLTQGLGVYLEPLFTLPFVIKPFRQLFIQTRSIFLIKKERLKKGLSFKIVRLTIMLYSFLKFICKQFKFIQLLNSVLENRITCYFSSIICQVN